MLRRCGPNSRQSVDRGMDKPDLEEPPLERSSSFIRMFGFVIAATITLAFVLGQADRETVMGNWAERRCDLSVLLTSGMYKPDDYGGSRNSFATENFNFCMRKYAAMALGQALQPAVKMTDQSIQGSSIIGQLLGTLRLMSKNLRDSFAKIIDNFHKQYVKGVQAVSITAQRLNAAMGRIEAIITSFMYITLSTYVGLMNTVEFIMFICIIIILCVVIIFIILFLFMWPLSPLLIAICVMIAAAGMGGAIGGAASVFCFAEETEVALLDGGTCRVAGLKIGQRLADGGVVEGMFTFDGVDTQLYNLYGVFVSGTHLVLHKGRYMEVASHPDAVLTERRAERLYCPIVSSRKVPVQCPNGLVTLFCDWEEVDDVVAQAAWDNVVEKTLKVIEAQGATCPAGLAPHTTVQIVLANGECKDTYITNVQIGQTIMGADGRSTKVLGVVRRQIGLRRRADVTDGVWYLSNNGQWSQKLEGAATAGGAPHNVDTIMYHLITDSGNFGIYYCGKDITIRDATEVGIDRLRSCTPTVLRMLNNEMTCLL